MERNCLQTIFIVKKNFMLHMMINNHSLTSLSYLHQCQHIFVFRMFSKHCLLNHSINGAKLFIVSICELFQN